MSRMDNLFRKISGDLNKKLEGTNQLVLIHAVPHIRNAVKNGLVSDFGFCTVVSYFFESFGDSRFLCRSIDLVVS